MAQLTQLKAGGPVAKITLYTSHFCPRAHPVHIAVKAVKELKVSFEEITIDLDGSRVLVVCYRRPGECSFT